MEKLIHIINIIKELGYTYDKKYTILETTYTIYSKRILINNEWFCFEISIYEHSKSKKYLDTITFKIYKIIKISQNYGFYETREIWYSYGFDFNKFNIDKFKYLITEKEHLYYRSVILTNY